MTVKWHMHVCLCVCVHDLLKLQYCHRRCVLLPDLDDTVRSGGVGKIFQNPAREVTPAVPKTNRFFQSVSVRTHRDANGV